MTNQSQSAATKSPVLRGTILHLIAFLALCAIFYFVLKPKPSTDTVIYVVRHAEKIVGETAGRDPNLSSDGLVRANVLAELLRDKNIEYVHSSDYIRTRDTAAPLAEIAGVEIQIYDPRDLPALAARIKKQGGRHLVVGHSNTAPETVAALGGDGGTPIFEATEYDRLYIVNIKKDDSANAELKRYGARYKREE